MLELLHILKYETNADRLLLWAFRNCFDLRRYIGSNLRLRTIISRLFHMLFLFLLCLHSRWRHKTFITWLKYDLDKIKERLFNTPNEQLIKSQIINKYLHRLPSKCQALTVEFRLIIFRIINFISIIGVTHRIFDYTVIRGIQHRTNTHTRTHINRTISTPVHVRTVISTHEMKILFICTFKSFTSLLESLHNNLIKSNPAQ